MQNGPLHSVFILYIIDFYILTCAVLLMLPDEGGADVKYTMSIIKFIYLSKFFFKLLV